MDGDGKILECLLCAERYSAEDVESGLYQLSTFVCSFCYAKRQKQPHYVCCFGKPTTHASDGKVLLGHDPDSADCKRCKDREPCSRIVIKYADHVLTKIDGEWEIVPVR